MSLQELKEQVFKLSVSDRLALASAILESLQPPPSPRLESTRQTQPQQRSSAIGRMRGLLKTDKPAPTGEEVAVMLEERRMERYLE